MNCTCFLWLWHEVICGPHVSSFVKLTHRMEIYVHLPLYEVHWAGSVLEPFPVQILLNSLRRRVSWTGGLSTVYLCCSNRDWTRKCFFSQSGTVESQWAVLIVALVSCFLLLLPKLQGLWSKTVFCLHYLLIGTAVAFLASRIILLSPWQQQ